MSPPELEAQPPTVHLLVSCFGLWGEGIHLKPTEDLILAAWKEEAKKQRDERQVDEFVLLDPEVNASMKTLDGIDLCASRIREVVLKAIEDMESEGKKLVRFSMLGYSLGGLVARYLLALLLPALTKRRAKLVNFITIASPSVGIPAYSTWQSSIFIALGSRLLSRSGSQLYARDKWADTGKPLLENLTTGIFKEALESFERIEIYACAVQDVTVPFPTGAFEKHDPFAGPLARARKARSERGAEETEKINILEGGLEVKLSDKYWPLIENWKPLPIVNKKEKTSKKLGLPRLPNFLKPSWYPFLPVPMRYLVCFGFPVVVPLFFTYMVGRFYLEKRRSSQRVKVLLLDPKHQEETHFAGFIERSETTDMMEEVFEASMPQGPPSSVDTSEPPSASTSRPESPLIPDSAAQSAEKKPKDTSNSKHQPKWTDAQLQMLDNLNSIPHVKKHFAWFPDMRNAHGAIICRHPMFGTDGQNVIKHLADHFVF